MKNIISKINANKITIIRRTAIIGAGVIGLTLAAGLIKVVPTEKTIDIAETAVKAAKAAKKVTE